MGYKHIITGKSLPAVTADNYYDRETNGYMSNSQRKRWMDCPRRAYAHYIEGNQFAQFPTSDPMAFGAVVDAIRLDPSDLPRVEKEHYDSLFKAGRKTKANPEPDPIPTSLYEKAKACAEFLTKIPIVMNLIEECETQTILTFLIDGMAWKCRLDLLQIGPLKWRDDEWGPAIEIPGFIYDMKCMASMHRTQYSTEFKTHVDFITTWEYAIQLAIYQEAVRQQMDELYGVGILGIGKPENDCPDPDVRLIPWKMKALHQVTRLMNKVRVQQAQILTWMSTDDPAELHRCEKCNYCRISRSNFVFPYESMWL